jgi:hypothetical protein
MTAVADKRPRPKRYRLRYKPEPPTNVTGLAPRLKRELRLWDPFDYLRLFYWIFFFPQALRWYINTFGRLDANSKPENWRAFWRFLWRDDPAQGRLWGQAMILLGWLPL